MLMRDRFSLALLVTVVGGWIMCGTAGAADLYVARNGDDSNPGTRESPLATLVQARDAVRELKEKRKPAVEPITVWLAPGTYELAAPFRLDAGDGGTANAPVTYRAEKGPSVSISGGKQIPADRLQKVRNAIALARLDPSVRDKVRCCDLASLGVTDLGELNRSALNGGPMLELFINGRAQPMARWPNKGWATYGKVIDRGSIPRWQEKPERPGTLEYTGDRPERWVKADEIWLHGYWAFDWYDDVLKVKTLDATKRHITFTTPHMYGLVPNRRYAALNMLEEIDMPGEWVLDRTAGVLYLYPPGPLADANIVVSMLAEPLFTLTRTSYVTIRDLTFEYGRDSAVVVRGGIANLIAGCTIRNMGTRAIDIGPAVVKSDGPLRVETGDEITDGRRNRVVGCDIYGVGTIGIAMNGGDRRTLAPAGHEAVNNNIHHYSRRKRTNCPAIGLVGVGNRVAHNFIHDAPHIGLFYSGNDHVIELNEACRLCWETGDVGVFYSGRDWTFRGNVVRHNFIHHTIAPGRVGSMGVYLDDGHSSTHIYGNVFYKTDYAAFIGGGRDNVVENNVFVDCRKAVHLDNRSQGWAHKYQKRGGDHRMYGKLQDVRHSRPPHSTRYAALARILDESPHEPRGNKVLRNVCVRGQWLHTFPGAEQVLELRDNLVTTDDPGFVAAGDMNFALLGDAEVFARIPGFQAIPFEKIGLYTDEFRSTLPLRAPRIRPDGGPFVRAIRVTVQSGADAEIRYTLDGTEPTSMSPRYTGPIDLAETATLAAVAFPPTSDPAAWPSPTAEARFVELEFGPGKGVFVSDLEPAEVFSHGGLKRDMNYRGNGPVKLGGKVHRKAIMICPEKDGKVTRAHVTYDLHGALRAATRFKARVGIDDAADARGTVAFKVEAFRDDAWHTLFATDTLRWGPGAQRPLIDVDMRGAQRLRLSVDGGPTIHADHAAWADAKLE